MATPAFVNATTPQNSATNTLAVNMPASLVVGNLIIVSARSSGGTFTSVPAGWTAKLNVGNSLGIFYRRVTGSETATYTFGVGIGNIIQDATSIQVSGVIASGDPFNVLTTGANTTSTTSAALSTTTTVDNTLVVFTDSKAGSARTLSTAPTTMTNRSGAGSTQFHWFDVAQPTAGAAPASGTYSCVMTTSSLHFNALFAIKGDSTTISPGGIDSTATVGTPTVTPGSVTVSPGGIDAGATVGTPTVVPGSVTVTPGGIDSAATLGTPTVTPGSFTVSPDGIDSSATVGEPTVIPGVVTVSPTGIDSTALLGSPTVIPGAFTVEPAGIDSTALLGTPTVIPGGFTVSPPGIGSTSVVGMPTVLRQPFVTATVYDHETGNPLGAGATVQLFDEDGTLLDTTTTDANGVYIFYLPFGFTDNVFTVVRTTIGPVEYQGVSEICAVST